MFARTVLLFAAAVFAVFGVWLFADPSLLERWVGVAASSAAGRTEIRAFYGGLELGFAAFLMVAVWRPPMVGPACLALGLTTGGIALARILGMWVDGSGSLITLGFLGTEVLLALLGFAAFARSGRG